MYKKKEEKKQFKKKQNTDVRVLTNSMQVKHTREHTGLWACSQSTNEAEAPSLPAFWSRASARAVFIDFRKNQYYIRHFLCCRVQPIARDDAWPFGRRHKPLVSSKSRTFRGFSPFSFLLSSENINWEHKNTTQCSFSYLQAWWRTGYPRVFGCNSLVAGTSPSG